MSLRLLFWKKLMQSRSGHPRNFNLMSKFSYMRPVFPDYLSFSYDYDRTKETSLGDEIYVIKNTLGEKHWNNFNSINACNLQKSTKNVISVWK